jgi:alkane 1-monooxygenase
MNALLCADIVALLSGGGSIWLCFILVWVGSMVFDEGIGDGREGETATSQLIYDVNLYATIPLLIIVSILFFQHLTTGDPLGLVRALSLVGIEFESASGSGHWDLVVGAAFTTGYFYALAGMTVGHELAHRATAAAQVGCRILLAFTLNTAFAIAHVHGHHRNVDTYDDPGSARRGEYILAFAVRCSIGQLIEAFRIEAGRLTRKGLPVVSWQNRALRDHLYVVPIYVVAFLIAGYRGVIGFTLAALAGTLLQKFVDYSQHYGLVRVDGSSIEERHSWDCLRLVSKLLQYNLPLHSNHHRAARTPFWQLKAAAGAPRLPCGYQTAAFIALLVPPLWHRMIDPLLRDWDERLASDEERALVKQRGWEIKPHSPAWALS